MAQNLFGLVHTLLDNAGAIEVGGTIEVYDAGTSTPRTLYSDRALTTTAGTSITADAAGRFPERWIAYGVLVKLVYKDADGATLATRDYANDNASIDSDGIDDAGLIRVCATYAAMTALTAAELTDNCVVVTYARATEEDGGFGFWRWDAAATTTANAGTVLAHNSITPGRFIRQDVVSYNVRWFGAKGDDSTDDSTAIQAALTAANTAGGGTVFFPPGTYRCMSLLIYSSTTLVGLWPESILKLASGAGNTSSILANSSFSAYTDSNITIDGLICDGNNQGNGGAQARYTGLVEFGRVTGLKVRRLKVQNTAYIGFACGGIREFDIEVEAETCGYDGATSNGGPAVYVANQGKDQSRDGRLRYFAKNCRWIGGHVNGSNITIEPSWKYVKEAGLFTAYLPSADILCRSIVVHSVNGNGVTEHDISGSGLEMGARGVSINGGIIRNCDHNGIVFTDAQDVTFAGGMQIEGYNQDTQSSSPQALGVTVICGSASPDQARNILVTGVSLVDDVSAFTVTISNATPAVITKADHGLDAGDMVQFTTGGSLPTGLTASTKYFVREDSLTDDTFTVSATRGGAAIATSSAGSGTHTCTRPTTAYGKFGIGGSGTAATNVRFINNDGGRFTSTGSDIVTTKFGVGCWAMSNVGVSDVIPTQTIASATTTTLASVDNNYVAVSGTTTITSFGTAGEGTRKVIRFTGALTLTHNATSLILKTGANITTAADDTCEMLSLGSGNWLMLWYQEKNGTALA